jgi:long-chain fatty acid transport protein
MACFSSQTLAAAFQLVEQNVTNLGLAFSGTAALAEDASTAYSNPAGLTRLGESEVVVAGFVISGSLDLSPVTVTPSIGPGPVFADDDNNAGTTSPVGALYVSKRVDERWVLGFSITTPFGLFTKYEDDSTARYLATKSQLETYDFSPSIGFRVFRCLSIGAGADALYTKAKLNSRIGLGNPETDGLVNNSAEGWGYGWHAGILWEPFSRTRLGFNYRSDFPVRVEGNTDFQTPLAPAAIVGPFTTSIQTVSSKVILPSTATFSLYQGITRYFAVTADVAWTDWSKFDTLKLRYSPDLPNTSLNTDTFENFDDSYRYALGFIYTPCDRLALRIGVAFDETPVQDEFRTARIPDGDRTWFALGAGYAFNKCFKVDIGYAYISFADVSVNEHAPFRANTEVPANGATLVGDYKSSAHIGGIQIRYDFV